MLIVAMVERYHPESIQSKRPTRATNSSRWPSSRRCHIRASFARVGADIPFVHDSSSCVVDGHSEAADQVYLKTNHARII